MVSMNTIVDNKKFQPIAVFTAMLVSVNVFRGVKVFTFIALAMIFISGMLMALNIYSDKKHRIKNSVIEFAYVIIVYLTISYMPTYIRSFYSILLVIIEYAIYILYINPKFMNRKLVYSTK